jgi:hypothetical protein
VTYLPFRFNEERERGVVFFLKEGFPLISIKEINIYKVFHLTHTSSQGTRVFETTRMAGIGGKSNKGREEVKTTTTAPLGDSLHTIQTMLKH